MRLSKLKLDDQFRPCSAEAGDELFPNGIFEFNISRLLSFIQAHADRFPVEPVELTDIPDYADAGIRGVSPALVRRARSLVKGVKVDLNTPLRPEDQ